MTIKMMAENDCKCAQIRLSREEMETFGVDFRSASLTSDSTRRMLTALFGALRELCGLDRDGHFTAVTFRPLLPGGCRLDFFFTGQPCGRCFRFARADDLLDALGLLDGTKARDVAMAGILPRGDSFAVLLPASRDIPPSALYILDEYAV